uniref:Transcription factor n=1 Tax=Euperipatoides kanangrensis TaxID=488523 RepID=S6DEZ5_9BILA|nr:transcription factor [Euperipatoides kanangrensis]
MKRNLSDSEHDDVFDESCKGTSPSQSNDSCQVLNRKKRRGIIEKRRRDRINNSLTELRRLVPTAFEKQGSAKLEKAEILQMTVDHLRMLHSKGLDALAFDPHKFAMDYHSVGFRECASEVARYLVTVEGMDIQDPLRLRLMGHLQCYSAQREVQTKAAAAVAHNSTSWSLNPMTSHHGHTQYNNSTTTMNMLTQHNPQHNNPDQMSHHGSLPALPCSEARIGQPVPSDSIASMPSHGPSHGRLPTTAGIAPVMPAATTSGAQISPSIVPSIPHHMHASQYPLSLNTYTFPNLSPNGNSPTSTSSVLNAHAAAVKPLSTMGNRTCLLTIVE